MNERTAIVVLIIIVVVLAAVAAYQYIVYKRSIQKKLKIISRELADIMDSDSNRKIMMFTNNKVMIDMLGQINRILLDRQRIRAEYLHSEELSKKMLSNISHDIKTPMTVILGYLEIMRLQASEDTYLITVEKKANQVMNLINQFFTLAKLEAGDTDITLTKININEVCREAVLDFYELLSQKNFQVKLNIPEINIYVQGNADALNRILFNLISNAVRYGGDGRYIGIDLHTSDNMVYIDVIDHGQGIERDFSANVFERLYTMEDSRNKRIQGNGLGLTIAKSLAVQMGGDIYLESTPNVKTIFTVKLKGIFSDERKK